MRRNALYSLLLGALTLCTLLAACNKQEKPAVDERPLPNANGEQLVDPDKFVLNPPPEEGSAPQPPPPPPEPPNPQPTGESWVFTPRLTNYIGQSLEARYKMPKANPTAWIAIVPSDFAATDAPANMEATRQMFDLVPAAEAAINVPLTETGQFRLRLFDCGAVDAKLLGETPPITVTQWPLGSRDRSTPPYVTIGPPTNATLPVKVEQGLPVIAYYEVPAGYPPTAWIGVIPQRVISPVSVDNDGADVAFGKLEGTKAQFTWKSDREGTFIFRIFPSDAPGADYVAESEPFTIVPNKK